MGLVFLKASVANFAVSEQSLGDEEDVLHLASNPGFLILYGSVPIKAWCLALPMKAVDVRFSAGGIRLYERRASIPRDDFFT